MMKLSRSDTIILHIAKNMRGIEDRWPLTQPGISSGTKIDRTYVSKLLKELIDAGLVEAKKERLKGAKRKITVYVLTPLGWERAKNLGFSREPSEKHKQRFTGKINVLFDENYAFHMASSSLPPEKTLVLTIKNPEVLIKRYSFKAKYIWLTYISHPAGISPDRLDFDVELMIEDFLKEGGQYLIIQGLEYLCARFGFEKIEEFVLRISKKFESIKIILAVNDPNSPLKEIADMYLESSTVIPAPISRIVDVFELRPCSLVITDKNKELAKKSYGDVKILSVRDDMEVESLMFEGLDTISRLRPCAVHVDCPDTIIRHLGDRAMAFFKDLIDVLSKMHATLEVKKTPLLFESAHRYLFENIGLKKEHIFVNRVEELKKLKNVMEDTNMGNGHTVLITGSAGIGKTSLVEEFLRIAALEGFRIFRGQAYMAYTETYLPYREAFGELFTDIIRASAGENIPNVEQRNAMFYDLSKRIEEMSREMPVVVFVDDIQWMDASSLGLMLYLSSKLKNSRVLFIYTLRDDEINENLKDVLSTMSRYELYESIKLHPLEWKNTRELICKMLGISKVPETFVDFIYRSTLGNPLFVKELVRKLVEDGKIDPQKGSFIDFEKYEVPKIIKDVVSRKIATLSPEERKILEITATYGKEIPVEILQSITGMDFLELAEKVDNLIRSGFITEFPEQKKIAISHPLIGNILYEEMSGLKRNALHMKIAGTIEKIYGESPEKFYGELAYHYTLAGEREKGVKYHTMLAELSLKNYAYETAINHYEENLKISDVPQWHVKIGDIKRIISDYSGALKEYETALKMVRKSDEKADILLRIALTLEAEGKFKDALKYAEESVSICTEVSELSLRAIGLKGWLLMRQGNYDMAEKIFENLLKISENSGNKDILSRAHHFMGTLKMYSGKYEDAILHFKKALSLRKSTKDEVGMISTLNNLGLTYKKMEKYDEALNYYRKSKKISEKIGNVSGIATALVNMGVIYKNLGKLEDAIDAYAQGLELAKRIDDRYLLSAVHTNLGFLYLVLGDIELARSHFENSKDIKEELGDLHGLVLALTGLGDSYRELNDCDTAKIMHRKALNLAKNARDREGLLNALLSLLEDEVMDGRICDKDVELLKEFLKEPINPSFHAEVLRLWGFVLIARGERSGLEYIEKGAREIGQSGNMVEESIYNLKCGKFLIEHGIEAGKRYLTRSAEIFKKIEMKKRYEEVSNLLSS